MDATGTGSSQPETTDGGDGGGEGGGPGRHDDQVRCPSNGTAAAFPGHARTEAPPGGGPPEENREDRDAPPPLLLLLRRRGDAPEEEEEELTVHRQCGSASRGGGGGGGSWAANGDGLPRPPTGMRDQDGGSEVVSVLPNGGWGRGVDVDVDPSLWSPSGEETTSSSVVETTSSSSSSSRTDPQENFSRTSGAHVKTMEPTSSIPNAPTGPSGAAVAQSPHQDLEDQEVEDQEEEVEVKEVEEEEEEEEEEVEEEDAEAEGSGAASGPGLSYPGSPAPGSPPCSVSPRSRPEGEGDPEEEEGDPDDAFADESGQGEHPGLGVSPGPRNTYAASRRQSAPGELAQSGEPRLGGETAAAGTAAAAAADPGLQSRRPGIAEYFGRGLFSRKQRPPSQSAPGWKLFGKVPPKESPTKNPRTIQQVGHLRAPPRSPDRHAWESHPGGMTSVSTPDLLTSGEYEARQGRTSAGSSPTQHAMGRSRKNLEFEPLSTTALILEDRPANLPAKSLEEAQRHRQQYNEMVAEAKKRELKEAQKRQRQVRERLKQEESITNAMVVWNNHILPHWDSMRASRRARDLWWQGLPPNVRGRVWSLAIGNELNITPELYEIFLSRAMEKWRTFDESPSESDADDGASLADRESSLELIKLDISRTFPSLYIFQKDGPYHNLLHSILGAYTCYRPDIGYVQGMSFIAAVLILNMEEADAFISFANLINKPCQMTFFRVDHELMLKYFGAFEVFFEENLPRLFNHFLSSNLTPDLYLIDWIFSLYTKPFPLDVACRVWDVFCRDGEEFLFRVGLGILRLYQDVLLQMDFIHIAQFLARLPDEELLSDRLFSCIAATPMLSGNRKWNQSTKHQGDGVFVPERSCLLSSYGNTPSLKLS
ncbi:TBC1 domain family member 12 [Merluccius polli]|uniref:TBC1 domain family member 12 n=1 Tax=Merluccius polli TaxID=89951 RepID=A0AA47P3I2_MERPO|nr:TBC1 domain family member 12 [Merluccius polli]